MTKIRKYSTALILFVILALSLTLRLTGLNWDDYARLHPDERFLTTIVSRIGSQNHLINEALVRCPNLAFSYDYFNTDCSFYNPDNINEGSYAYGTLPLFIVRGAAHLASTVNIGGLAEPQLWLTYDYIHLVGRFVNAVADTLSVLVLFFVGRRLFTSKEGLVAAAFYGFAVFPIQQAHFWTVDTMTVLFFLVGLWAAVGVSKAEYFWSYLLFGLALGAAGASRINMLPMAALLPLAVLIRLQTQQRLLQWRSWLLLEVVLVLAGLCVGALVFRIAQPYAFVGPTISDWSLNANWLDETSYVSNLSSTATDGWPPSVQWFDRIRYVYPWFNMIIWGMSAFVGIGATIALVFALLSQLIRLRLSPQLALISLGTVGYFAIVGNVHLMTMRYYLPVYPLLFLLLAWGIFALARRNWRRQQLLVAFFVGTSFAWGVSFVTSVYTQPVTRLEASGWINDNIMPSVALYNENDERIPVNIPRDVFNYRLQPVYNGESYISEPFSLNSTQSIDRFEMRVTDTEQTRVQLQLMREENTQQLVISQLNRETDENGYIILEPDELPEISEGTYRWHLSLSWDSAATMRQFLSFYVRGDVSETRTMPIYFLSPYQPVIYGLLTSDRNVDVFSEQEFTATEFTIAHVLDEPSEIYITTAGGIYTATPQIEADLLPNQHSILGASVRYTLDRPMTVQRQTAISLSSEQDMYFTGTTIAHEGAWDDSLPARYCEYSAPPVFLGVHLFRDCVEQHSAARYWFTDIELNMAETDSEVKYRRMVDILIKADYLAISSNRFYDAQIRVPRRFAMSNEYYNRLFGGELGYPLLQTFQRASNILGLQIPHDVLPTYDVPAWLNEYEAEEAFTVYDHPTVFIFSNESFVRDLFPEYVAPESSVTGEASPIETLDLASLPESTYSLSVQPLTNSDVIGGTVAWIFAFLVLGWVSFPLMYVLFPSLPLRGFSLGRTLTWLVIAIVPWWLTSFIGEFFWMRVGIFAVLGGFIALNAYIAYRRRAELLEYIKPRWKTLLFTEGVFLAALWFGLLLRAVDPNLWAISLGGEKPMDFAYLNSVLRTPVFPPPNPWFAGYAINYYYFGFVVTAAPIKLLGLSSELGYNLAMGTLYAVIAANVFTLAYALIPSNQRNERIPLATVGTLFAMVAGNLGTLKLIVMPEGGMAPHRWYWYPTRILGESANNAGGAINEFPIFSFLFGDMHAHIIGLLPVVFYLTMLWVLNKQRQWWIGFFIGISAGMIYMTNTWDVLLYVPIGVVAIWLSAQKSIVRFIVHSIPVVIGGVVSFAPYALNFTFGQASGIEAWHGERSLVEPFILVWGIPIGIAVLWMLHRLRLTLTMRVNISAERGFAAALFIIVMTIVLALQPIIATSVLLILLTLPAIFLAVRDEGKYRYIHATLAVIFGILFAIEYIVVRGDVGRMNTIFKISFQIWIWLGVVIPSILYFTLRERRYFSAGVMVLLIGFGLLFPFYAIPARYDESLTKELTLDGGRYLNVIELHEGDALEDLGLVRYMRANLTGFPVIAEWYQSEYRWNSRISVQTGLPAVVGWANHMRQQFSPISHQVDERVRDIQTLYITGELDMIREILNKYHVEYVVYGVLERQFMPDYTIQAFEQLEASGEFVPVYRSGQTTLYRVENLIAVPDVE